MCSGMWRMFQALPHLPGETVAVEGARASGWEVSEAAISRQASKDFYFHGVPACVFQGPSFCVCFTARADPLS